MQISYFEIEICYNYTLLTFVSENPILLKLTVVISKADPPNKHNM